MTKRLGILHAYPGRYLLDTLYRDNYRVVLIGGGAAFYDHPAVEKVIEIDLGNHEGVKAALQSYHADAPFDALLPVYEGGVPLTAEISEMLGLPGVNPVSAYCSRNKYLAQIVWQSAGVPTPSTIPLPAPLQDWPDVQEKLGGRAVIKLADSMNSQGVARVESEEEYLKTVRRLLKMTDGERKVDAIVDRNRFAYGHGELKLIAQSYCSGAEVGVDVFLDGDRSHVLGVFEKHPAHGPYFAEHMSISPTCLGSERENELGVLAIQAVRALGARYGAAHVEIRFAEDGPKVLEAGLRPGGAYTVMAIERMRGVNCYRLIAAQLTGHHVDDHFPSAVGATLYGGIVYPCSGVLEAIEGQEVFDRIEGVIEVHTLNKPGDVVLALPESAQPHFCYYLLEGDSREEVLDKHYEIQSSIRLTIAEAQEDLLCSDSRRLTSAPLRSEYLLAGPAILDILDAACSRPKQWPTLSWSADLQAQPEHSATLPEHGRSFSELVFATAPRLLDGYCNVSHPLYFGYISPKPHPAAVLGDLLASGLNQTPGAWRAGPFATTIEVETLSWICQLLGYPQSPDPLPNGIFTGGGTIANLIALKLARDRIRNLQPSVQVSNMTVYMSIEGHFSVGKALDVLAIGKDNLRSISVDGAGCIDPTALAKAIEADIADGKAPIAIVGVAGTSATGAIDPLTSLARIAREQNIWFHVDGAAGAVYAALHDTRPRFDGLALADSVTLDPCKWMFVPFGMGCLLVKRGELLRESFWSTGHYWEELDELDTFKMNLYGTRQWRSLGLWMLLSHLGRTGYIALLQNMRAVARAFAEQLAGDDRFELLAIPELPVLAFRVAAEGDAMSSRLTRRLQRRLVGNGRVYLTMMDWRSADYIRIAINNYATTMDDMVHLKHLLDEAYIQVCEGVRAAGLESD